MGGGIRTAHARLNVRDYQRVGTFCGVQAGHSESRPRRDNICISIICLCLHLSNSIPKRRKTKIQCPKK
ncbi:hypothetical protein V1478_002786 [Vespula squamosa]|uniref:Uncharacterized protein n=1 Tax=Vespula squamosa TaxID=30214 RepID=A0ABD2BSC3_VESSQ